GIARPASRQRVDVGVAVQHEAGAAPGPPQGGDGLAPSGLDLLEIDVVAARAEELLQEEGDSRLLGLEARDAAEGAGQLHQLSAVDVVEHGAPRFIHGARAGLDHSVGSLLAVGAAGMAAEGRIARARAGRSPGHAMGPNQAPPATAPALIRPKAARAALRARNTCERSPLQRRASHPPAAA